MGGPRSEVSCGVRIEEEKKCKSERVEEWGHYGREDIPLFVERQDAWSEEGFLALLGMKI